MISNEVMKTHGIECGIKIAEVLKELYPDAICIVPLFRSSCVITQSQEEKEKGYCTIHLYTDPHWFGKEINAESLMNKECHKTVVVQGNTGKHAWAWKWIW